MPSAPSVAPVNPPIIMTVSPTSGSTAGGTTITITGSGFQTGLAVTLGGERQQVEVPNSTSILMTTTAHGPGPVEVIVANPDGQTATLSGGYSYALPQSFDFNGTWEGFAAAHPDHLGPTRHSDMGMRFTIERNVLTSFTCGGATAGVLVPACRQRRRVHTRWRRRGRDVRKDRRGRNRRGHDRHRRVSGHPVGGNETVMA